MEESGKTLKTVPQQSDGKRTILIAEDNRLNREMLAEILADKFRVLEAENGADALEILQENISAVSLVILDLQMPVMDGYEFLQKVRESPFLSQIPVVISTGSRDAENEKKCLRLGAIDFMKKPYNPDIILCRAANIIRLRESSATVTALQTDEQTGLYTLQAFYYYARQMLDRDPDKPWSVIAFDVDRYRMIKEVEGEQICRELVRRIGESLKDCCAASDIPRHSPMARFLVLKRYVSRQETDEWLKRLFAVLKEKTGIRGITFSAGIYDSVSRELSVSQMYERAVAAMGEVDQRFENRFAHYSLEHEERELRAARLEASMKDAYYQGQFRVYFQPKHDADTGELVGAEALIRWVHPEYGFLSPAEFIPLFEKNGFIYLADYFAWTKTCACLRSWMDEGIRVVPVSVNASRRDFEYPDYLKMILKPVRENRLEPSLLHIEVTETVFSGYTEEIRRQLQECRDAGFRIELDDFGTGYSSLGTLASFPLDVVKLDMSFMKNYKDERNERVLSACISLAGELGLKTVCEGVETRDQALLLQRLGCDWIQGFYYSRPIPEEEFREYLKSAKVKSE